MSTAALGAPMGGLALRMIDFYREHLSGHKRFLCAAGMTGHQTCSAAIRNAIAERGLLGSIKPAVRQFQTCRAAAVSMTQAPTGTASGGPVGGGSAAGGSSPEGGGPGGIMAGFRGSDRSAGGRCCILPL